MRDQTKNDRHTMNDLRTTESRRPVRGVMIDLDDTLFDHRLSSRAGLEALRQAYDVCDACAIDALESLYQSLVAEVHHQVLRGELSLADGRTERTRQLFAGLGQTIDQATAGEAAMVYRDAYQAARVPIDGALELLRKLRQSAPVAIVTNHKHDEQIRKLEQIGLMTEIDHLVTSGAVGIEKPVAGIFEFAMAKLGVSPDETVMFGDSWAADVEGAAALGIRCVWLNRYATACPNPALATERTSLQPVDELAAVLLGEAR